MGRLTFSERTRLTTQAGRRDAGPIELQAAHVTLMRNADVTADASSTGHAGQMTITADTLKVTDGSLTAITAPFGSTGGNTLATSSPGGGRAGATDRLSKR